MSEEVQFHIEALEPARHNREEFECGVEALTRFLRERARKEMESKTSACFVAVPQNEPARIAGYYTLSAATILSDEIPAALRKRFPKYPQLPATLLGRLARDLRFKRSGVGSLLLMDALARAFRSSHQVGAVAVVTDPKETAVSFYEKFGFQKLNETRMFLPMSAVELLVARQG